ncbi:MAG: N-6 DNA methylase, partial [bacterium]|nr:N-6 DNA methylase [bacterium]
MKQKVLATKSVSAIGKGIAGPGLLTCPVRGPLSASALAADNLTPSEEARRIDFIHLLIDRGYPPQNISVETVILKKIGEKGRNNVRADVVVFDRAVSLLAGEATEKRLKRAILVAEIKRDQKSKASGISHQLEPAMMLLPSHDALGVYWDDINQILLVKKTKETGRSTRTVIEQDSIANLPRGGSAVGAEPILLNDLRPTKDLMGVLHSLANLFRSHKINDEATRYRETVKLILARYCDERAAKTVPHEMKLQVLPGTDPNFMVRVREIYAVAAKRYHRAKTLYDVKGGPPALSELAMREAVKLIQGISFTSASSDVMQQVFMSFVPAVFKKSLDQYFTPLPLIDAMVDMANISDNETVADPAMGTADFLSSALTSRQILGDDDIVNRLYGADADKMAFDLAIVNMILHKDGQSNFENEDSIEEFDRWEENISVALCNPPFGEKSLEKRSDVLENYCLGHIWEDGGKGWVQTDNVASSQQLGILFIEKCFKMLHEGGRIAIILPEGYLCTASYGYVRQWILDNFKILALVELPRRIFNRSDADLRANILIAEKLSAVDLRVAIARNYPIYAELIRKVGFKMGKGFSIEPMRDPISGIVIRDSENNPIVDSDFTGLRDRYRAFRESLEGDKPKTRKSLILPSWKGARVQDIISHPAIDMKPRRLTPKAVKMRAAITAANHFRLSDVANVLDVTIDLQEPQNFEQKWRLVEGISIRAVEGTVVPHSSVQAWQIIEDKQRKVFRLQDGDIVIGLVRPERRNVGILMDMGNDIVEPRRVCRRPFGLSYAAM